ncbi:MAG TPA: RES family NAD+ phosphorylase [Chitinivibrionales bacterium]|nr:RES family NAD+ phosphorylase [Chitinivibrionales bacterium]
MKSKSQAELDPDLLEKFTIAVQEEVAYCDTCQPWDGGDTIWIHGVEVDWEDVFNDCEVPKEYREEVASRIQCPFCGSSLDIFCTIGVKSKWERNFEMQSDQWQEKNKSRFDDFYAFLQKFPYLGCSHELGKTIINSINNFPKSKILDEKWYRSRKVNSSVIFSPSDMMPPDPDKVEIPEGRFNHFGQPVFYLSRSKECAATEALDSDEGMVWTQEFRIKGIKDILDLAPDGTWPEVPDGFDEIAFGLVHCDTINKTPLSSGWKPEYFIPRFIADVAKMMGYDGIKFKSSKTYHENLVLFKWDINNIEAVGTPVVYQHRKTLLNSL